MKYIVCVARDVTGQSAASGTVGQPSPPPWIPPGALWIAPDGEAVVKFLAGRYPLWTPCDMIADHIGEPIGARFKARLTVLVDRRILEAASGAGYRIIR